MAGSMFMSVVQAEPEEGIGLDCNRVTDRANGDTCPNEAVEDVLVQINNVPYLTPMCSYHRAEFRAEAAKRRQKRNQANAQTARSRAHGRR